VRDPIFKVPSLQIDKYELTIAPIKRGNFGINYSLGTFSPEAMVNGKAIIEYALERDVSKEIEKIWKGCQESF
jgi:hypothetical protein